MARWTSPVARWTPPVTAWTPPVAAWTPPVTAWMSPAAAWMVSLSLGDYLSCVGRVSGYGRAALLAGTGKLLGLTLGGFFAGFFGQLGHVAFGHVIDVGAAGAVHLDAFAVLLAEQERRVALGADL